MKAIVTHRKCSTCDGEMLHAQGLVYTSQPPKYQHVCNKCKVAEFLDQIFPSQRIDFDEKEIKHEWTNLTNAGALASTQNVVPQPKLKRSKKAHKSRSEKVRL